MHTRINQNNETYQVDTIGSEYIDLLHKRINLAKRLAHDIIGLNPTCLSIGAGRLANLQEMGQQFLDLDPKGQAATSGTGQ